MTNPNNAASLEDCHSNFFALTDLCGIKWRRLVSDGIMGSTSLHHSCGPLDDPVLSSFAKCLAADVLCVWRRCPNAKSATPPTPHDPFHPGVANQNHYMHHSQPTPGCPPAPPPQMQMQPHMPPHMMQQHLGPLGMGPGHMGSHHMGGPPPYSPISSAHNPHSHGMPPQSLAMHPSFYNNNPSLNGPKELWIFWYGEDPDLSGLVNSQLLKSEADQGSWESGLSYECRTLLFKALHNLIERCLLARDFVRIGKWFIQPCDDNQRLGVKHFPMQLSFSLAYFVHGESTVCMSVDVRQHPAVRRIGKQHLAACQSHHTMPVILAPHGLAGTLTGVGCRLSEPATPKILEEWKHFYPVEAALKSPLYDTTLPSGPHSSPRQVNSQVHSSSSQSGIPPVLEVLVGGVRMRYPSCYVLCTEMDESPRIPEPPAPTLSSAVTVKNRNGSVELESTNFQPTSSSFKPLGLPTTPQEVDRVEGLLPERVWQESVLCSSKATNDLTTTNNNSNSSSGPGTPCTTNPENAGQWDFTDPSKKTVCTCSKCKRLLGSRMSHGLGNNTMSSQSTKGGTKIRRNTFHKRNAQQMSQANCWSNLWDLAEDTSAINPNNSQSTTTTGSTKGTDNQNLNSHSSTNRISGTPGTPLGGPSSYKAGSGNSATAGTGSECPGASPASVAPSPLPTSRSQPPSIPQNDTSSMPLLSPPPVNGSDKTMDTSQEHLTTKIGFSNQIVFSPNCFESSKTNGLDNSTIHCLTSMNSSKEFENAPNFGETRLLPERAGLKRPVLPWKEYESLLEEECSNQPSETIYDYTVMEAWLDYPVKKSKTNEGTAKGTSYSWGLGMKLSDNRTTRMPNGLHERSSGMGNADPYEFDDENHQAPAVNMDGLKRKDGVKEEEKIMHCLNETLTESKISGDLFTSAGLQPSYRDLDQIFDNSDTSSDEAVPTPPGSNKPAGGMDDIGNSNSLINGGNKHKPGLGNPRPDNDLSKMFPTPPSHEHNPISSPCGLQPETPSMMEGISDSLGQTGCVVRRVQDIYTGLSSPPDEQSDVRLDPSNIFLKNGPQPHNRTHLHDWSYVYKPVTICKMLGSSKYAPLSTLPSQQLLPLTLPHNSIYKPTWQYPCAPPHHHPSPTPVHQMPHHHPVCMGPSMSGQMQLRPGLSPISPVPNPIRGPLTFDLGSPPPGNMYLKQGPHGPIVQHPHGPHSQHIHHPHHHIYGSRGLEAHALVVNLSLSDSVINLFRDHNFDSCTMCVCNAGNRVVGNIRGSEVGPYIPDPNPEEEDRVRCNCGFSASVNRRLAHRAGLFYEDEFEITTPALAPMVLLNDEFYEKKKPSLLLLDPKNSNQTASHEKDITAASAIVDTVPPYLLEMLREQCLLLFGTIATSRFTGDVIHHRWTERTYNYLDYLDGNRAALTALEHGRTVMIEASGRSHYNRMSEDALPLKPSVFFMHKWPYLWARGSQSSQEVMQVMRALLPLLQDAVHVKTWDAQYNVSGPLTWRQFHRLAGRGTDDRCEPQPIPSLLVGSEKDWVALSPLAIKFWERLPLEPYAYPRDIAYFVVAPDNDFVLQKVRTFFRELSSMYEICQLGRHSAISRTLRGGILRVGRSAATVLATEPVDEWFTMLPDIPTASTLKLYAQVCRHHLVPILTEISLDQSLLEPTNNHSTQYPRAPQSQEKPAPSPKMPPPNSEPFTQSQGPLTPKNEYENEAGNREGLSQDPIDDDERDPPAIVIYLVEPFGFGSDNKELHRMASLGLLRCFSSILNFVPENIKNNITLQVISLEDIMNLGNSALDCKVRNDQTRALALTVYSQCRRLLLHQNTVKSLTGFGPAAAAELFLKTKDKKKKGAYKLYTPPYVLAPIKEKVSEGVEWLGGLQAVGGMVSSGNSSGSIGSVLPTSSSVLYVAYCISEDHRWLLASATDDRGELLETTTISIYVPNRSKRRKASARKHGLQKLMDFILGIISMGVQPWRLVVGRLGRVGHGELESWSTLLSRKSLLRASSQLKDACRQCSLQYPVDTPCVLSACLVSLEPDSCLRLMPDQFTPDERFGAAPGSSTLSTPQDVSCSHVLVFPTSATTQSSQTAFQEQHINCPDMNDDDLLFNPNEDMIDVDGMQDLQLGDLFTNWEEGPGVTSPVGSPRRDSASQPGSPSAPLGGRQSPFQGVGQAGNGGRGDGSDELGTLLQQPLALGYLVSTAPSGHLPPWFWASCPQRAAEKGSCIFLKSALHLHSHSVLHNIDDILQHQSSAKQHPLDSQFTTDVLRFVLEGYNALSWLCLDPATHDRKSCLPVHIQKLLQLYYTVSALL